MTFFYLQLPARLALLLQRIERKSLMPYEMRF
jgi:hypothetical protein